MSLTNWILRSRIRGVLSGGLTRGAVLSVFNACVRLLAGIWLTPLLLRFLGVEGYGRWVLLLNMLTFLFFFDAGIFPTLRNRMGKAFGRKAHRAFQTYAFTTFVIGGVVFVLGVLAIGPALALTQWSLPDLFHADGGRTAVIGVVLYGAMGTAFYCVDSVLLAQLRFGLFRIGDLVGNVLYIVGTIATVKFGGGLFWLVTAYLLPRVLTRVAIALFDLRALWWRATCSWRRALRILRLSAADAFQYSGVKVAEVVMTAAPAFLLEKFGDIHDVASFGAHMRIAVVPNLLVVNILPIFWSDLTNRFARGAFAEARKLYYLALAAVVAGFLGWVMCISLTSQLVNDVLFAGEIAFSWNVMGWLLAYYLVMTLGQLSLTIVNSQSRFGITLGVTAASATACLALSIGLHFQVDAMTAVLAGFAAGWLLGGFLPGHWFVGRLCRGR